MAPGTFVVLFLLALLLFRHKIDRLAELLAEASNKFRGGPPTPMHPVPSNDSILLRKRVRKVKGWRF
ncbi:MAG TPA: hypothetical protein VMH81_26120 [Bryobacteraceae bacterium]|nr:hypothetical protein [Bryobacteraceae bacterium]